MIEDPIVEETRTAREQLEEEFGHDLNALWEHLQKVQDHFRDRVISGNPRPPSAIEPKVS